MPPTICISKLPIMLGRWGSRAPNPFLSSTNSTSMAVNGTQFRGQSNDCFETETIKCGEQFNREPCKRTQSKKKSKFVGAMKFKPLPLIERSIVPQKIPDVCCPNPCRDSFPRFDSLYYRRTDKLSREFQQTWNECPELVVVKKPICCFDKIQFPVWKKRPKTEKPETACTPVPCEAQKGKCKRLVAPGCIRGRVPPSCARLHYPANCKKRKAPYPSYSECQRDPKKPKRGTECRCLTSNSLCTAWAYFNRMAMQKKPPNLH